MAGNLLGRNAKIALSTDDSVFNDIGDLMSASISFSNEIAENTTFDSNGYAEGCQVEQSASLDIEFKHDVSDVAQVALHDALSGRITIFVRVRPAEATGEREYRFEANISDTEHSFERTETQDRSATLESTGTIAYNTQI